MESKSGKGRMIDAQPGIGLIPSRRLAHAALRKRSWVLVGKGGQGGREGNAASLRIQTRRAQQLSFTAVGDFSLFTRPGGMTASESESTVGVNGQGRLQYTRKGIPISKSAVGVKGDCAPPRKVLLMDNMPLAIDLITHLVETMKFSPVPRILSLPESRELLSLLSILADGLSDTELLQSKLPIDNILACKAMLLHTSLAYLDDQKRLKSLVPIREYIQRTQTPMAHIVQPLLQHFQELLEVYETYHRTASNPGMGLNPDNPDLVNTIYYACYFDHFSRIAGYGFSPVIDLIPIVFPQPRNHRLEVYFNLHVLSAYTYHPVATSPFFCCKDRGACLHTKIKNVLIHGGDFERYLANFKCLEGIDIIVEHARPLRAVILQGAGIYCKAQHIVDQALESFRYFDDIDLKCRFYDILSGYFYENHNDIPRAVNFAETGLSLVISTENIRQQSDLLGTLALVKWSTSDYSAGMEHAYESQRLAKIAESPIEKQG
ncbi:hypothetical protein FB451DRAFT_1183144 [Mycena latifolia]|nr:hypothetical protein FB451DRAFT_1183144 [Mycena latifolia]